MCGRFTLRADLPAIARRFAARIPDTLAWQPRFNIAPTQPVIAVRLDGDGRRTLTTLRWGLIPHWAKERSFGNRLINARAETVATRPAFRTPFRRTRCLVPADGYYEWQARGKGPKQPFWIRLADQPIFAMAGLWDRWRDERGHVVESVAVITTAANEATRSIHDRMPAILAPSLEPVWLGETGATREELLACLTPYPDASMVIQPVSTYVNRPQHEGPRCLAPPDAPTPPPDGAS